VLVAALTASGLWVVVCKPWGLDGPTAGALAGVLFGGAAVLLGNLINRANQRHEKTAEVLHPSPLYPNGNWAGL